MSRRVKSFLPSVTRAVVPLNGFFVPRETARAAPRGVARRGAGVLRLVN